MVWLRRLTHLGVHADTAPREVRYNVILNVGLLASVAAATVGTAVNLATHQLALALLTAGTGFIYLSLFALNTLGFKPAARIGAVVVAPGLIFIIAIGDGPAGGVEAFYFVGLSALWLGMPPTSRRLPWVGTAWLLIGWATLVTLGPRWAFVARPVTGDVRSFNQGVAIALLLAVTIFARNRMLEAEATIERERARSEGLLSNMLPAAIAEQLKDAPQAIAQAHDAVTVLFADIVGFTPLSQTMTPHELVRLLNEVFTAFDELARRHGLEKIKTIGDAYMVVGGVPRARADHAAAVAAMALDMRDAISRFHPGLNLRIGLHTGPAVAGVIGTAKYSYDLWGDTVNTAARMESHGEPGRIQLTAECLAALGDRFTVEERGTITVKGKGELRTFWLLGTTARS
jgi:class 3 adenylate cyclase